MEKSRAFLGASFPLCFFSGTGKYKGLTEYVRLLILLPMSIIPPKLPFPNYKWRWAVTTPSEGLNHPPVFLGVLRAMRENEGKAPNSDTFIKSLALVQKEAAPGLHLARTGPRNLIRNSGQYWKALGLTQDAHGKLALTTFGQSVADGKISREEFSATIVRTLTLPNRRIEADASEWDKARLELRPLEIILQVVDGLHANDPLSGYLTKKELVLIIIPLAGEKRPIADHVESILAFRGNKLDLAKWPDCTPRSNDQRMASEFIQFLTNYGFLEAVKENNELRLYRAVDAKALLATRVDPKNLDGVPQTIRREGYSIIPRVRRPTTAIARPKQAKFRRDVLKASENSCLLTGKTLEEVLIGAHLIPVENGGEEEEYNGVSLRSDIHILFDSGDLRIDRNGNIYLSDAASEVHAYSTLPKRIKWPAAVSLDAVDWRFKYY